MSSVFQLGRAVKYIKVSMNRTKSKLTLRNHSEYKHSYTLNNQLSHGQKLFQGMELSVFFVTGSKHVTNEVPKTHSCMRQCYIIGSVAF